MAINTYGVSPSIGEAEWAILHRIQGKGQWHEVVDAQTDFAVTPSAGNRIVSVAAGSLVACGVLVVVDTPTSITLDVQSGGNSRIDYIVLEIDWTGSQTTATTIKFVKGTAASNPVAPSLTRVAGTLWQVALARVTLTSGISQLVAANVDVCAPLQRRQYVSTATVDSKTISGGGESTIARTSGGDPGWPYRLRVEGKTGFTHVSAGAGIITGYVDGSVVTSGVAGNLNDADAELRADYTPTRTGAWSATMTMQRNPSMTTDLVTAPGRGGFTITLIPSG